MKLYETVAMIILMTLLPLIFLVPAIIFEFLERKQQKMFQFLLEFRPKKFIIPVNSISEEQFQCQKQFNCNANRSREEIRAIFSARNCPSSRELLSLLCTSPTQQSSSCTTRKDDTEGIRKYQRNVNTDIESSSTIQSSNMNSKTSIPKKSTITNDKFITSRSRRGTNMHVKRPSSVSATTRSFTRSLSEKS
ncbi:unnamed protein product [Brugia timori]|uniref:Uncharacterized protein n=1 Tax=Brugia timori TaxID=42155 RepID=A0A0R3R0F5_9BILA|nr:unnamed protein product [Brugia timori]